MKSETQKHVYNLKKHVVYIFESNYFITDKRDQFKLENSYKRQSTYFLIYYIRIDHYFHDQNRQIN